MSDIIYSPAACRLGGTGPVVCLLYPFTWILKARSAEEKPATCLRAAPPQRVLLVRVPAALAAPSPNHPAPGASACGVVCECAWKGNRPRQTATLLGSAKAKVTVGAGRWVKRLRWRPRHTWSTSDSSATASDGYSGGLPHMTREVEQYHGVVSANGVYHKSINGTRHEQANAHRRAILDDWIECCV